MASQEQELEQIKTPEFVSIQFHLAGLGSRAAAIIIDMLIITCTYIVLGLIVFFTLKSQLTAVISANPGTMLGFLILIIFLINWGYFIVCEYALSGKPLAKTY